MSHEPSHITETMAPPREQSDEGIHFGKVLTVGIGSIVIFFLATIFVWKLLDADEKRLQPAGPLPLPQEVGHVEIGIVDQVPFDVTRALQGYREDAIGRLESWGWVDKQKGVIHMPIERAMEDVVAQQGKGSGK
jgi:hypothetical protein